jgi:tetratricopeptide (TPR) repeat protein
VSLSYVLVATLWGPTPVEEALARVGRIGPRAQANRRLEVTLLRARGQLEAMLGRFDAGRELIAQAKALAEELGLEVLLASGIAVQAGYVELLTGDPVAAERELRAGYDVLERIGDWGHIPHVAPLLADALFAQGRDDEVLRLAELVERVAIAEDAETEIGWRRIRAKVFARRGDVEGAERLAREATALASRTDYLDVRARALADLAEVLRLAGRPEESAAAVHEAIRLYEQKGNVAAAALLAASLASVPR